MRSCFDMRLGDIKVDDVVYISDEVVVLRSRPVWDWERELKWSAPETGERTSLPNLGTGQQTIGI
jgi:hypothetical protein